MTLMAKNADKVDETHRRHPAGDSRFPPLRAAPECRPRVGTLLRQRRLPGGAAPRRHPPRDRGSSEEERLDAASGEVPRRPLSGAGQPLLRNRQVAAAMHGAVVVVLRRRLLEPLRLLDLGREGREPARERASICARCGKATAAANCATTSSKSGARTAGRRARRIRRFSATSRARQSRDRRSSSPRPKQFRKFKSRTAANSSIDFHGATFAVSHAGGVAC